MTSSTSSIAPTMFTRTETIGNLEVTVTDQRLDMLPMAQAIATSKTLKGDDDAFMILNLDMVDYAYTAWQRELPEIELFYAVKCNSDEAILRSLAALGAGFDCASKEEIDIRQVTRMGVSPDRIIYANSCKSSKFIAHAECKGVAMMTFDSIEELEKIAAHHKNPKLLLRFAASDPTAIHPPTGKYGAGPEKMTPELLKRAIELGINIAGVSFHVGSGCNDPSAYRSAIQHARNIFDIGLQLGHKMEIVDIGGGFPGGRLRQSMFMQMTSVIRSALDELFPEPNVRVIAESGRFLVARTCALAVNVIARKPMPFTNSDGHSFTRMHYFINDGIYGTFNCKIFDHERPNGKPLFDADGEPQLSTIWGPTCDSDDRIEDMGAYTTAASFTFNGFPRPGMVHVISEPNWKTLGLEEKTAIGCAIA